MSLEAVRVRSMFSSKSSRCSALRVPAKEARPGGFEGQAERKYLCEIILGKLSHDRRPAPVEVQQPFTLQLHHRLAHRRAADSELLRERGLGKVVAWGECARDDGLAHGLEHAIAQGLPRDGSERGAHLIWENGSRFQHAGRMKVDGRPSTANDPPSHVFLRVV